MGTVYLNWLPDVLSGAGLPVIRMPGAENYGNRRGGFDSPIIRGLAVHHTASNFLTDGLPDAKYITYNATNKPIAQLYLSRAGVWYWCASGCANTMGLGGPYKDIPKDQANFHVVSVEVANNGIGETYPEVQQASLLEGLAVLWVWIGGSSGWHDQGWESFDRILAHFQWAPTRKIDPKGPSRWSNNQNVKWDMNALRADVINRAAVLMGKAPDPTLPPPPTAADYDNVSFGIFTRNQQWPYGVSMAVWGDPSHAGEIQDANPVWPSQGGKIIVPNKPGRTRKVKSGEGQYSCLKAFGYPQDAASLAEFDVWNGGSNHVLQPGEQVYMPHP